MGAGQSLPRELTHEKLFELTKDTRNVMNILLEYMLKEVSVRDFLSLSNPTECNKYVLFMANNLYQHFYELQIYPTKDKRGTLVFRSAKDLTQPMDEQTKQEKQGLCLILAFYYTRIFQIYGALALTLLDDITLASDTGMLSMAQREQQQRQRRLIAPGLRPYAPMTGGEYGTILTLGNFAFLKDYLQRSADGFLTDYKGEGSKKATIYFKKQATAADRGVQRGTFRIVYGNKTIANLEAYAAKERESDTISVEFQLNLYDSKKDKVSKALAIPSDILPRRLLRISPGERDSAYYVAPSNEPVPNFFTDFFEKLVPYIKGKLEDVEFYSDTGAPEQLRLDRTIQNLTKNKPLGHCIARALQLLQTQPFDANKEVSLICKAQFVKTTRTSAEGTKTVESRSGIPEPGASLATSPGLMALSSLFYDTLIEASPKVAIGTGKGSDGRSTMEDYVTFMRNLAILFGDNKTGSEVRPTDEFIQTGLRGISNKRDKELCKSEKGAIPVTVPTGKLVSKYVNKLFQLQLEHAAKCGAIFQKLFSIQRDRATNRLKVSLSDNIVKKGFPEIQRINAEARKLLVQYYTNCEKTYLYGMNEVLKSKQAPVAPVAPVATMPAPSAPPASS
jgi:hypothetical protein